MSKDDYAVIVCKVLSYLYACLKQGVEASPAKAKELAGCNDVYWNAVLDDMEDKGFIAIDSKNAWGHKRIVINSMRITIDGVEYLDNNSTMSKVRDTLGAVLTETIQVAVAITSMM